MKKLLLSVLFVHVFSASVAAADQLVDPSKEMSECLAETLSTDDRIQSCEAAAASNHDRPSRYAAFISLGKLHSAVGEFDLAIKAYEDAVKLGAEILPRETDTYAVLAVIAARASQDSEAVLALAESGMAEQPFDPILLVLRSEAYQSLGNAVPAIADLEEARLLGEDSYYLSAQLMRLYMDVGRSRDALAEVEVVLDAVAPGGVVEERSLSRNGGSSVDEDLRRALPVAYEAALYTKMGLYLQVDEPLNALDVNDELLGLAPGDPDYVFARAKIFQKLGRLEESLSAHNEVIEFTEKRTDAYFVNLNRAVTLSRASLFGRLGQFDDAMKDFDDVFVNFTPAEIEQLQSSLMNYGIYKHRLTGRYDDDTRASMLRCLELALCFDAS